MYNNSFLFNIRHSSGIRLSILFFAFFIMTIVTSLISSLISHYKELSERDILLIGASIQCILVFCIPALISAKFASDKPFSWLSINKVRNIKPFIGVIIVYFIFMPAMNGLIEWNSNIHFPASLSSIEETFRNWENASQEITIKLLDIHNPGAIISGICIIGILTGFSEELFFRGALQNILSQSNLGKNLSIWITAFIFSAIHFQFFGFFPRLLMGIFFGYLLVWTNSLWIPVFAHSLNNSLVVLLYPFDVENPTFNDYGNISYILPQTPFMEIISIITTFLFFYFFRDYFFYTKKTNNL